MKMAGRRIAKSAVDWAALTERINPSQRDHLRAFKAKSDAFVSRVHLHPESMPKIDFSFYKSRVSLTAMVDEFENAFKALSVPYPKDKDNVLKMLENEEQIVEQEGKDFVKKMESQKSEFQAVLGKIDSVPKPEEMTHQMFPHYFPESSLDPVNRPTLWPHTAEGNNNEFLR